MCSIVHAGRPKDDLQQSVLSYCVGPSNQIQLSGLAQASTHSAISLVPVPVFNRWVAVTAAFF